ncbi:MAG: hypothetical protein IPJ68_02795 [Candidatus Moraniibacteriota bacterium]|nr:MAG: hypothetical protein IPJ68_02795 [Candidatus Moranbacteria bacterium]
MQKIWKSGLVALAVAVAVGGATYSFFSDTETSTGNTFTAGAIDLTVDSQQHYNNAVCVAGLWQLEPSATATVPQYPVIGSACDGTWAATNLGAQKFFNFADVKPGDSGEDTISLHVDSNDAFACVDIDITKNDDVSTVDPETDAGDAVENAGNNFDGELAQNLNFFAWADTGTTPGLQGSNVDTAEGDNIWQANELPLFSNGVGSASDVLGGRTYRLADAGTGALAGGSTSYIGLAWCAGNMTAAAGVITCDGSTMGNVAQTDSLVANVAFRVEQARNNPNFSCSRVVRQGDLAESLPELIAAPNSWLFHNDSNDAAFIMTTNQFAGTGGANEIVAGPDTVGAARFVLDNGTDPLYIGTNIGNPRYNIATYKYKDVKLSDIGSLKYRIYDASASSQTPYLHFNVDFNNSDTWQRRLVQVPTGVAVNTWTTVDALAGNWTYSGPTWPVGLVDITGTTPGTTSRTWADVLANYPNAETRSTDSFFGVRVGHPGPIGETSFVDWIEFDGEVTDFEN